jgi:KUP system potassium uptake protein
MAERVEASSVPEGENTIEEREVGAMWELEQKLDQPMDEEANKLNNMYREKGLSMLMLLRLSFQSLGIVYGDLGTSPLYVFYNTFPDGIDDSEDVIGALSLIIYSLLLIPLIKYVFIVCKANDNGQGGTLAIYSLLCRHAKVKLIPNQHRSDEDLTTYSRTVSAEGSFAAKTKKWLEGKEWRKRALLVVVLLGTCMMIGDGILTPAISGKASLLFFFLRLTKKDDNSLQNHLLTVLSATGGIKVNNPKMSGGNIHFTLFSTSGFESVLVLLTCYFSRLQISSCLWQLSF